MVSLVDATSVSESITYRVSPFYQRSIVRMGNDIPSFPQGRAESIAYLLRVDSDPYILSVRMSMPNPAWRGCFAIRNEIVFL